VGVWTYLLVHKKRDQLEVNKYRAITLLIWDIKVSLTYCMNFSNPTRKIFLVNISVDLERANQKSSKFIPMRQIPEMTSEYGISTFHICVDFRAVYIHVNIRDKLLEILK
jgi:hypothetical protein